MFNSKMLNYQRECNHETYRLLEMEGNIQHVKTMTKGELAKSFHGPMNLSLPNNT